jgi:hypothetical protein
MDEIPGISRATAQGIIAETGLDMDQVPHPRPPGVLGEAEPARSSPGPRTAQARPARVTPYLKAILGEAAVAAARTGASRRWLSADGLRTSRTPPPPPTGRPDWARPARPGGSRLGRSRDHRGGMGEFRATPPFPA